MIIGIPKETDPLEKRVALIPDSVKKILQNEGIEVRIEKGAGNDSGYTDVMYKEAGAKIVTHQKIISESELIARVGTPAKSGIASLKKGSIHLSYLDPFNEKTLVKELVKNEISAVSMEMVPRTTRAQKMDVLSSQASLQGYAAVITAAEKINKIFPMMMTPAGTISPVKVFIIGAGVAGLQAIATAKRLGARVEAFDTRPVVEEQVKSLGAKFVKVDLGETGQTKDGYAKALTDEQLKKQQEVMKQRCLQSDIVITTAQLFGRKAPLIITKDTVDNMKPGSILVDLAVKTGGNIAGSKVDKIVDINGVKIIGISNFPSNVAFHASQMYSNNITNFILEFWDKEKKELYLNLEDEIIKGCLITHKKELINETIKKIYNKG